MNTSIEAQGFKADQQLTNFIQDKISKLPTYYDKVIDCEVKLSLENHSQVKDKTVRMMCNIPGSQLFAESTSKSFEESVDQATNEMISQIKKKKSIEIDRVQKPFH